MIFLFKFFIRFTLYKILDLLPKNCSNYKELSICIVRLDAIGDYVLFRNFIESIKRSKKYDKHNITLIGNIVWKDLAINLDAVFVEHFIWVDRQKFINNLFYRRSKLNEITSFEYDVCISPVYSREFFYSDWIIREIPAKEKIGSAGDCSNIEPWQKRWSDLWFDRLMPTNNALMFEFDRNREFFSQVLELDHTQLPGKPFITLNGLSPSNEILLPKKPYAVFFIGAFADFRKWPVKSFAQVASHLYVNFGYDIVLCGGPSDIDDAEIFMTSCSFPVTNLVGKTSLVDLMFFLKQAQVMVSNETSGPHFAVALNVPYVFVVSNGNHYGRFIPYPKYISNEFYAIYHPDINECLDEFNHLCDEFGMGSTLDIKEISVESVLSRINKELDK